MKKNIIICLMLSLCLTACGKTTATIDSSASTETSSEDDSGSAEAAIDLEQFRTDYIGDNSKVVGIASNQKYPEDYSYDSVELQTEEQPYELKVFLKKDADAKTLYNELDDNANQAFDLIGNMEMLTYMVGNDTIVAQYTRDENGKVQPSPFNYSSVIDRIVEDYADNGKEFLNWNDSAEINKKSDALVNITEDSTGRYNLYGIISEEEGTYGFILNDNQYSDDQNMNHAYVRWYYSGSDDVKPTFEWKGETLYLNYQAPDGDSYKDVTSEVLCGFETGHMELMPEE